MGFIDVGNVEGAVCGEGVAVGCRWGGGGCSGGCGEEVEVVCVADLEVADVWHGYFGCDWFGCGWFGCGWLGCDW